MRFLAIFLCLCTHAQAEGSISAAGRLEHRDSSCSAALIAPNLVITAAHCIDEGETDRHVFRPNTGAKRMFAVKRAVRHQLYDAGKHWRFRFDFALVELVSSVPSEVAVPLKLGDEAELGEGLFILSWRWQEDPRQRRCPVIKGASGVVTLGCRVQGGESGAPVVRKTDDGLELVAVISSRGFQLKQPIAQASNLRNRLQPLLDRLKETSDGS